MATPFKPEGAWTALLTPFTANGKLDLDGFKRLAEFQIAEGISGLVPAGTTGESPTLTWEEHNQAIEACVSAAQGRVGVLAGTGSNCTDEAVTATRHARDAGACAALLVDCYYNGPSSLELRTEYYERVIEWVPDIPIVPYIIPARSGTALSAEDLALLHKQHPARVPAVKQATGDLLRMRRDRALSGRTLAILSGDDELTGAMMLDAAIGCAGVISVMSNLVPGPVAKMTAAYRAGDRASGDKLANALLPLFKLVGVKAPRETPAQGATLALTEDKFRNPVPVKTILAALGLPAGPCRRPLGRMTRLAVDQCRAALRQILKEFPEALAPLKVHFGVDPEKRIADDAAWAAVTRA